MQQVTVLLVCFFLMEKKTYNITVIFVSSKVWISLLMIIIYVMKIMPFFHFVFLNSPQTVIITWHMHDFVSGSDPVVTVHPIYRMQILLSPIEHIVSQQTYWDFETCCTTSVLFCPKCMVFVVLSFLVNKIFMFYIKSVLKFKCPARFIWLVLGLIW